jgi:hypothetical protein
MNTVCSAYLNGILEGRKGTRNITLKMNYDFLSSGLDDIYKMHGIYTVKIFNVEMSAFVSKFYSFIS